MSAPDEFSENAKGFSGFDKDGEDVAGYQVGLNTGEIKPDVLGLAPPSLGRGRLFRPPEPFARAAQGGVTRILRRNSPAPGFFHLSTGGELCPRAPSPALTCEISG
jgi:hypothetical protein